MPFVYRFDPISGTFSLQPTGTVESLPYWVDTNSPTVREYVRRFGAPPKGMTPYEMKLAIEADNRNQRQWVEEQFWTLIKLGQYEKAAEFAEKNSVLGKDYAKYAKRLEREQIEKNQAEREAKAFEGWARDPYIQLALRELGLDPRQAYYDPTLRYQATQTAIAKAHEYGREYQLYEANSPKGKLYLEMQRALEANRAKGFSGAYNVDKVASSYKNRTPRPAGWDPNFGWYWIDDQGNQTWVPPKKGNQTYVQGNQTYTQSNKVINPDWDPWFWKLVP